MDLRNDYNARMKARNETKATNAKAIQKAKAENFAVRQAGKEDFSSVIKEAAKTGDIAINRSFATNVLDKWNDEIVLNTTIDELKNYVIACKAYAELQIAFNTFYESSAFKKICADLQTGELPANGFHSWYNSPSPIRLADSSFRGTHPAFDSSIKSCLNDAKNILS